MSVNLQNLSLDLTGKKALVTGAAQGMGQAMALVLARQGACVVVHDRTLSSTDDTVTAIRQAGGQAYAVAADLEQPQLIRSMVDETVNLLGGLDIVINNAGIGSVAELEHMDEAFWDRMQTINLKAPFLITKYALETMRGNKDGGRLIYISSTNAKSADHKFSAYAAAKAGMLGSCVVWQWKRGLLE